MKGKMEFSGAGPVFGALGWNVQTPSFGTSELRSGCRDPQRTHTHTHTHTHNTHTRNVARIDNLSDRSGSAPVPGDRES